MYKTLYIIMCVKTYKNCSFTSSLLDLSKTIPNIVKSATSKIIFNFIIVVAGRKI